MKRLVMQHEFMLAWLHLNILSHDLLVKSCTVLWYIPDYIILYAIKLNNWLNTQFFVTINNMFTLI